MVIVEEEAPFHPFQMLSRFNSAIVPVCSVPNSLSETDYHVSGLSFRWTATE